MNKQNRNFWPACISLCFLSLPAFGQYQPAYVQYDQYQSHRFYIRADAGGSLVSDTDLREFFGPVAPNSTIKFEPGYRFGAAFGYEVTSWFAAEGQTGIMANWIDSITDATRTDAVLSNIPFLANVKFQLPNLRFTPYVGAGVGMSTVVLDSDDIDLNGVHMHGSDAHAVFAWQAFGGLRYRIQPQMEVSIEYRYFWADPSEWHAEFTEGTLSNTMRWGGTETQTLSLAFTYRF